MNDSDDPFDSVWHYGRLTNAYQKRARLAEIEQRNDDVVSSCLCALVLDGAEQRGGIVSQAIVDNSWWASKKLYKLRESLTERNASNLSNNSKRLTLNANRLPKSFNVTARGTNESMAGMVNYTIC